MSEESAAKPSMTVITTVATGTPDDDNQWTSSTNSPLPLSSSVFTPRTDSPLARPVPVEFSDNATLPAATTPSAASKTTTTPTSTAAAVPLDVVKLNVGGRLFWTSRRTLTWAHDTFFASLMSGRIPSHEEGGCYFIDRDPELFSVILNFLRTRTLHLVGSNTVNLDALYQEAVFYGITPLIEKLDMCGAHNCGSCGGLLFNSMLGYHGESDTDSSCTIDRPVKFVCAHHNWIAIAFEDHFCCYSFSEATSWTLEFQSPMFDTSIDRIALNVKYGHGDGGDKLIAFSQGSIVRMWDCQSGIAPPNADQVVNIWRPSVVVEQDLQMNPGTAPTRPPSGGPILPLNPAQVVGANQNNVPVNTGALNAGGNAGGQERTVVINAPPAVNAAGNLIGGNAGGNAAGNAATAGQGHVRRISSHFKNGAVTTFDLGVPPDALFFIGSQLVALSSTGRIGVWNSISQHWQNQLVQRITSHDHAGSTLVLGHHNGCICYVDVEKFPLRMKDNDLLVNDLYRESTGSAITALSVYLSPASEASGKNLTEIAYGTASGLVRVIIQHPETAGQGPQLFHTYSVHRHKIATVELSEKYLVCMCDDEFHVRTWKITRFRGRISTQPGAIALASFKIGGADSGQRLGPFGERDESQIFVQRASEDSNRVLIRDASTGERVCILRAADLSPITTYCVHECDTPSRVGSRSRRFFLTGHLNGTVQVWDLALAIDFFQSGKAGKLEEGKFDPAALELLTSVH